MLNGPGESASSPSRAFVSRPPRFFSSSLRALGPGRCLYRDVRGTARTGAHGRGVHQRIIPEARVDPARSSALGLSSVGLRLSSVVCPAASPHQPGTARCARQRTREQPEVSGTRRRGNPAAATGTRRIGRGGALADETKKGPRSRTDRDG